MGDPLDVKMFEATGWIMDESREAGENDIVLCTMYPKDFGKMGKGSNGYSNSSGTVPSMPRSSSMSESDDINDVRNPRLRRYKSDLMRRFEFSSSLQRMSVICKNMFDNKYRAFVKGSPEKISELCKPESLPTDF